MTVRGQERGQDEAGRAGGEVAKEGEKNAIAPLVCCAAFVMSACNKAQNVISSNSQPPLRGVRVGGKGCAGGFWRRRRRDAVASFFFFFCRIKTKTEIALC